MVTDRDIQALADRIVADFRPQKVILFGSRATGSACADSDVDLMVLLPFTGESWEVAAEIRHALPDTFGIDVIVRTQEEFAKRCAMRDPFFLDVAATGRVLFAA